MNTLPSIAKIFSGEFEQPYNFSYTRKNDLNGSTEARYSWLHSSATLTHTPNDITITKGENIILKSDLFSPIFDGLTADDTHKMNYYFLLLFGNKPGVECEDIKHYMKRFVAKYKQSTTSSIKTLLPVIFPLWKYALENEIIQYDDEWVNLVLTEDTDDPVHGTDAYEDAIAIANNKLRDFRDEYRKHHTIVVRDINNIDPEVRNELILNMCVMI